MREAGCFRYLETALPLCLMLQKPVSTWWMMIAPFANP